MHHPRTQSDSVLVVLISLLLVFYPLQLTFAQVNESISQQLENKSDDSAGRPVTTNGNTSGFIPYDNPIYGISVEYPSGWSKVDMPSNQSESYHLVVEFFYPLENNSDKYQEEVAIAIDRYGGFESTTEYLSNLIDIYMNASTHFKVLENDTNSILDGRPAYRLVFDDLNAENDVEFRALEFGTMIDNIVYSISYYAEKDKYDDYLPLIQEMIKSFKIMDVGLEPI